jgi:NADH pyrophosphatase NudC (nudix superfamily)
MILALAIVVALAALAFTLFVRTKDVPEPLPVSPVQHLEDRKRAIYDNLRDLQFEYRLGKLSDEDYQQTKQALQKELAGVLAEIEETLKRSGLASAAVTAAKTTARKTTARASTRSTCPHCGANFAETLKFCGECGKPMHEEVRI